MAEVSQTPRISDEELTRLLGEVFACTPSSWSRLNSYDDVTCRVWIDKSANQAIRGADPGGYVFKVTNPEDSRNEALILAQNAFLTLANKAGIPTPLPIANKDGSCLKLVSVNYQDANANEESTGWHIVRLFSFVPGKVVSTVSGWHIVRLFSFVPGKVVSTVPYTVPLLVSAGETLAKLHVAIWENNFTHPGIREGKDFFWSLEALSATMPRLTCYEQEPRMRKMMKRWYNEFDHQVLRKIHKFKKCVLHGDFNEQNLLCDAEGSRITGVIDFNDFHYSCRLFDIALLCAYMLMDSQLGMATVGHILAGYVKTIRSAPPAISQEWTLVCDEFKMLRTCIMARLVQSLVNGKYTWDKNPVEENRYVLITQEKGWRVMWRLDGMAEDQFQTFVREIFKLYDLEVPS